MVSGASARLSLGLIFTLLVSGFGARADPIQASSVETVQEATCRIVENAAHATGLPVGVLTRLIWIESRFKSGATSPAGAQGIAQFKPGTAAKRGLLDPYDPEQAIPHAAQLLVDLEQQFGNIGLATAAYNAGSTRVANWLARSGAIPPETSEYVIALTGRTPEDWAWGGERSRSWMRVRNHASKLPGCCGIRIEPPRRQFPLGAFSLPVTSPRPSRSRPSIVCGSGTSAPSLIYSPWSSERNCGDVGSGSSIAYFFRHRRAQKRTCFVVPSSRSAVLAWRCDCSSPAFDPLTHSITPPVNPRYVR